MLTTFVVLINNIWSGGLQPPGGEQDADRTRTDKPGGIASYTAT